jgi:hypothetical protein
MKIHRPFLITGVLNPEGKRSFLPGIKGLGGGQLTDLECWANPRDRVRRGPKIPGNFFRLFLSIILPDSELIWKASEIESEYAISYADCFATTASLRYEAAVLTGDREFKKDRIPCIC